jgi:NADP-dependent 3-hydroxy acid dehydrogenase YdfG
MSSQIFAIWHILLAGMVETEFTLVRFLGDKDKAEKYYDGFEPLTGQDVAEAVVFSASRPPHVNIGKMVVLPSAQAAVHMVVRKN